MRSPDVTLGEPTLANHWRQRHIRASVPQNPRPQQRNLLLPHWGIARRLRPMASVRVQVTLRDAAPHR